MLVVPAGRQVDLSLASEGGGAHTTDGIPDHMVIHSFWAPRLFGKQDVVPGRTNHITFSTNEPGVYWGQCAEFCGLQHGRMKFRIAVLDAPALGRLGQEPEASGRHADRRSREAKA